MKQATYNRRLSEATILQLEAHIACEESPEMRASMQRILDNPVVGVLATEWDVREELHRVCDDLKYEANHNFNHTPETREDFSRDRHDMLADLEYGAR